METSTFPEHSGEGTGLVRRIASYYKRWAYFISNHLFIIIFLSSVISAMGAIKILMSPFKNDITGYTPVGSRSLEELRIFQKFFDSNGSANTALFLLIVPKDGGNVLREPILQEVVRVEKILTNNFTMPNHRTGRNESYKQFCRSFCWVNEPIIQWINGYTVQKHHLLEGEEGNERIDLHYPISTIFGRSFNIQPYFYGVKLKKTPISKMGRNDSSNTDLSEDTYSNMNEARMLALTLRGEAGEGWTEENVRDYEYAIYQYFSNDFDSHLVKCLVISATVVEEEIIRAGLTILPYVLSGFFIMITVSTILLYMSSSYYRQFSLYKITLAFFACLCPFMACATGMGAMFALGFRFASILCVTPFLVLAIGVDDAYLMLHSWHRITKERRENVKSDDSPEDRLAHVLMDTGPSILISALTNILADFVGTYTGAPEITLLAYANMVCIFVDFIYQITFYSAVMLLVGAVEMNYENNERTGKIKMDDLIVPCLPSITTPICFFYSSFGHAENMKGSSKWHDWVKKNFIEGFIEKYITLLMNKLFAVAVVIITIAGLILSIMGIMKMEVNLTPTKLFAADSSLLEMAKLRDDYIIPYYFLATVLVSKPGNLSNAKRLARLEGLVHELESLPYAWGNESTNFFLKEFKEYSVAVEDIEEEETGRRKVAKGGIDMARIPDFVEWPEYQHWKGALRTHVDQKGRTHLDRILFTTAYKGEDLKNWPKRNKLLKAARNTLKKYDSLFNATLFMDDALFLDVIENMPEDMWQAAIATLIAMAFICTIFLQDVFTTLIATISIAATMAGILGALALAGTDLDPIVMAALIISMGFSVDIPAHSCYHFHNHASNDNRERIRACLTSVGVPAIQASISTTICVLSLLTTQVYMGHVFVRTMSMCVILCIMNGLCVIPTTLNLIHPLSRCFKKKRVANISG
uniref:Ptr-12 n=1 Tax=Pristionchus pacificus TaxID=54126 RepID=A0A8R1UXW4_PRIPA